MAGAIPYQEPNIITILTLSSFIIVSNAVRYILDKALCCGIVCQIFVDITYGKPGGNVLGDEVQDTIVQLGYLGLIFIVYEGETLIVIPYSLLS